MLTPQGSIDIDVDAVRLHQKSTCYNQSGEPEHAWGDWSSDTVAEAGVRS